MCLYMFSTCVTCMSSSRLHWHWDQLYNAVLLMSSFLVALGPTHSFCMWKWWEGQPSMGPLQIISPFPLPQPLNNIHFSFPWILCKVWVSYIFFSSSTSNSPFYSCLSIAERLWRCNSVTHQKATPRPRLAAGESLCAFQNSWVNLKQIL